MRRTTTILAALALAFAIGCPQRASSRPPAVDGGAEMLEQRGKAFVQTHDGREMPVDVEIASRPGDRARGLMFRKAMPESAGMIFVFPDEDEQVFWMKNTLLPLDMIFIDASGRIVGIVENAEPQTTTSRTVGKASKFVLEVNGGWAARHGVAAGDRVRLEGMYDLR